MIPIHNVTLYEDRAQITRTTTIQLNQGSNTLLLEGLSPLLVHKSVQVRLSTPHAKISLYREFPLWKYFSWEQWERG